MSIKISYHGRRKNRPTWDRKKFFATLRESFSQQKTQSIELSYIFTTDDELLGINRQFLNHDYYTDIITFDLSDKDRQTITGEIYISIDRVLDNATNLQTNPKEELIRVMFHGYLHLIGYKDKTKAQQQHMRAAEDKCLTLYRQKG